MILSDPTGKRVFLTGSAEEQDILLQEIEGTLEDPTAAGELITVTRNGVTELKIAGDAAEFAASSETASTLAQAITSDASISFFFGKNAFNSGVNYPAHTDAVPPGSRNSLISIDPAGFPFYTSTLHRHENLHSAIQHELGHALGIANGTWRGRGLFIPGLNPWGGTAPEAVVAENKAREWYLYKIEQRFGLDSVAARAARDIWARRPYHD